MHFRIEQDFAGPLDAVENAFVDPALLDRIGDLPKLGRPELLSQDKTADTVHQRVRYRFAGDLNSAARRVLDPTKLTWVEDSLLERRNHRTTWTIVPDNYGSRLACSGTFTLQARGPQTTRRVAEGDVRVSFPLVGSRVERAIVSGLAEHAHLEVAVVDAWMAEQSGRTG